MVKEREASEYSKAVAGVILGLYKQKRWNQERLAEKSGLTYPTIRRMIAGESEINTRELSLMAGALGTTPQRILDLALEGYGGLDALMSEVVTTTDPLTIKRQEKARAMTVEQIEGQKVAATKDGEMDSPESEAP